MQTENFTKTIYTNIVGIFADETYPFGTPYDKCATPYYGYDVASELSSIVASLPPSLLSSPMEPSIRFEDILNTSTNSSKRLSPVHIYQKIDGCYIRCDILDEKIFDAVVQLKDVHLHRSRYEANLIRARSNQRDDETIVRKKFCSARTMQLRKEMEKLQQNNDANVNDTDVPSAAPINVELSTNVQVGIILLKFNLKKVKIILFFPRFQVHPSQDVPATKRLKKANARDLNKVLPDKSEKRRKRSSIVDIATTDESNVIAIASAERKVRPVHVRSPMPKFIVTKVTEKEKSKETVKFDIRNELQIVRRGKLNNSFESLESARKMMRKEISDAHLMVQLQRRKSLRIFNAHDDTDSETEGLATDGKGPNPDRDTNSELNRWRTNSSGAGSSNQSTPKTIYTVKNVPPSDMRPKTNEPKMAVKTKIFLHRSNLLEACGKMSPHKRVIIETTQPRKAAAKKSAAVLMAETTDVESEYERNAADLQRKSQRQRQRSKKLIEAAESEPEIATKKQTKSRRSYVTDFDTDTDGEAFYGGKVKRRRQPNKKYQNESAQILTMTPSNIEANEEKPAAAPPTPKKPRREYKPRPRKAPQERTKSPAKTVRSRKSKATSKQETVVEITDAQKCETADEQKPNDAAVARLPSIYNFAPLGNVPDLNLIPHKKSCIGKSKSDVSMKIRTQDMLYSMTAKMLRRYSCFTTARPPIDLLQRVMSQRNTIFSTKRKSTSRRGKRKGRGRRATATKKRPDFTKKLLDSPDFSSLIDIARLNEINVGNSARGDDDDSGSDVGDIEQQLSVIRRGQHLGSLQTVSSPLAHIKLLNAGRTVQTRKSNTEKRKPFDRLITRVPLTNLKGMDLLLPMVAANEIKNDITPIPAESTKKALTNATNGRQPTATTPANDSDTNIVFSGNTFGEKTYDSLACEPKAKNDSCEIELITVPNEIVAAHIYDEDDIESPAFELHVSKIPGENIEENVSFGAQQLSKTRVRTKRTRGRIRWSKPRKRPPIQYHPIEDTAPLSPTTSEPINSAPPQRDDVVDSNKSADKLPPKILNSLQIQSVVPPTRRGRKRKNDNGIAPIVTVKSVTEKRGRYTRQETTKTVSLSIEPVNYYQ